GAAVAQRHPSQHWCGHPIAQQTEAGNGGAPAPVAGLDGDNLGGDSVARFNTLHVDRSGHGVDGVDVEDVDPAVAGGGKTLDRSRRGLELDGLARPHAQHRFDVWAKGERGALGADDVHPRFSYAAASKTMTLRATSPRLSAS